MIGCLRTQIKQNGWLLVGTNKAQGLAACGHVSEISQSLRFIFRLAATLMVFSCRGSFVSNIVMRIENESVSSFISLCVSKSYQTKLNFSIIEIT